MSTKGVPFDAIQGIARREFANHFCQRRGVQKSIRCDIAAYQQDGCAIMARAWCHRMQYFLNLDLARGESHVFTSGDLSEYHEPSEFTTWAAAAGGRASKRIAQIRTLFGAQV